MGIYNRDNINYGGFLQAAIANKIANAQRQADHEKAMAKLWGDTIAKAGQTIGRGAFYSYGGDDNISSDTSIAEDKAELAKLEDIQKKYNEQVAQRNKFDEIFNNPNYDAQAAQARIATNEMTGYNPTTQYMSQGASDLMKNYKPTLQEQYLNKYYQGNDYNPSKYNYDDIELRRIIEEQERNKYNPYLQNLWRA